MSDPNDDDLLLRALVFFAKPLNGKGLETIVEEPEEIQKPKSAEEIREGIEALQTEFSTQKILGVLTSLYISALYQRFKTDEVVKLVLRHPAGQSSYDEEFAKHLVPNRRSVAQ